MPELERKSGEEIAARYTLFIKRCLWEVEEKEKNTFRKEAAIAMGFLAQSPSLLGAEKKLEFLNRNNLELRAEKGHRFIVHSRGEHLREEGYWPQLAGYFGQHRQYDTLGLTLYSKEERAFIKGIAAGKIAVKDFDIVTFPYAHFRPLLSEKSAQAVGAHITRDYCEKLIRSFAGSGLRGNIVQVVEELEKRGLQIKPEMEKGEVKGYRLGYYLFPEASFGVGSMVREELL